MSILSDSHEAICGCDTPFAHLLANIFPIGHSDRNNTINQILWRDFKQLCHSGGDAAKGTGCPETSTAADVGATAAGAAPEDPDDLERLFAAAEEKEEER